MGSREKGSKVESQMSNLGLICIAPFPPSTPSLENTGGKSRFRMGETV